MVSVVHQLSIFRNVDQMCLTVPWVECIVVEVVESTFWDVKSISTEVISRSDALIVESIDTYEVWAMH